MGMVAQINWRTSRKLRRFVTTIFLVFGLALVVFCGFVQAGVSTASLADDPFAASPSTVDPFKAFDAAAKSAVVVAPQDRMDLLKLHVDGWRSPSFGVSQPFPQGVGEATDSSVDPAPAADSHPLLIPSPTAAVSGICGLIVLAIVGAIRPLRRFFL